MSVKKGKADGTGGESGSMRSEEKPRARRFGVAVILVALGAATGAWHNKTTDRGHSDPVAGTVRGVVAPPANAIGRVSRWFSDQTGWIFHGHALAGQNQKLRARVAELEGQNTRLLEAQIRYEHLRDDLKFVKTTPLNLMAADVWARRPDPKFDTLLIGRGSSDGVRINSPVMSRSGLVGRVIEVGPNTASVLMLTDQNSGVGARVQRVGSRATGVCKGDNSGLLSMVYLPSDADIKPGDVVVTSGLGGVFPLGLFIGVVKDVRTDAGNALKIGRIAPKVDFDRLEEVYVLK